MSGKGKASNNGQPVTFVDYLILNATRFAGRPAFRHKDHGIWKTWNWDEAFEEIRAYSMGLKELGIKPGDKVAIIGQNRPRLYWTFCAVQALGAVPVPVYADSVAEEMSFVLEHAEITAAVCQNQEQVDKIDSIRGNIKSLKYILYDEERGLRDYEMDNLHSIALAQDVGRSILEEKGDKEWRKGFEKISGNDVAVMLYTSGTTGRPKGVMLSYESLIKTSYNANKFDQLDEFDEIIAYLPLAWVGDHVFSYTQSYVAGYCVCCPESPETADHDRLEIAPTYFFAPPRVFEDLLTRINVRMQDASNLKQKMFTYFMDHARKVGEPILNGERVGFLDKLKYSIGEFLVYSPLKNRMGMSSMKVGYTAGEAIGPEIFNFYRSLGLNLKQLYGQTEASVYISAQPDGQIRSDTVGTPSPDVEIKIADNGEVLYRSPGVFVGYFKNDKATKETKTKEGWVHTGDAGFIDGEGHLRIIDRAKDVGKLKDGSLFAPKYIENKLKFFSNIKEVVAFGDGRDKCCVFLNIDLTSVGNWAERNNVSYASYIELTQHPEVIKMMGEHVEQVNRDLASEEMMSGSQIARFLVLHKELDPDDGEMTRTMKVRRPFIRERYGDLIEALFDGSKEKFIETEVVFEDGRKGKISATVSIMDAEMFEPTHGMKEAAE